MRYEYIEPFVSSAMKVLDTFLESDIAKGSCTLVQAESISEEISVVVRLKGDSEGSMMLNMPSETALSVSNAIFREHFESLNSSGVDSLLELANMIAGNAASVLNNMGFDIRVQPPELIVKGKRAALITGEAFQIPFFTEFGEITMNASINAD